MRIQYASDLHLEMPANASYMDHKPLSPSGEILVLAGDIIYLQESFYKNPIFDIWSEQFEKVFIIPGNHEFYGGNFYIEDCFPKLEIDIRPNVHFLNNQVIQYENVRLLFTTLFSRIDQIHEKQLIRSLGDFRYSKFSRDGDKSSAISDYNKFHSKSKAWLELELDEPYEGKTIVVTHHAPIPSRLIKGYPYAHDGMLNSAFHTDLSKLIESHSIDFWIYGHTHFNHSPIDFGNTRIVTNQLAYVEWSEHQEFGVDRVIKV